MLQYPWSRCCESYLEDKVTPVPFYMTVSLTRYRFDRPCNGFMGIVYFEHPITHEKKVIFSSKKCSNIDDAITRAMKNMRKYSDAHPIIYNDDKRDRVKYTLT